MGLDEVRRRVDAGRKALQATGCLLAIIELADEMREAINSRDRVAAKKAVQAYSRVRGSE